MELFQMIMNDGYMCSRNVRNKAIDYSYKWGKECGLQSKIKPIPHQNDVMLFEAAGTFLTVYLELLRLNL